MKCPHCLNSFHEQFRTTQVGEGPEGYWHVHHQTCPACGLSVVMLEHGNEKAFWVYPKKISRNPLPAIVQDPTLVSDYKESCATLDDSPKASAALSRRALQYILREKAAVKRADLSLEIQEVLDSGKLPTEIAENLDAVRNIGNFAAHPNKSQSTGEIVDVEAHEAEWNLEVLEQMIDYYYVKPAIAKEKRDALNAKLADAGKPAMRGN